MKSTRFWIIIIAAVFAAACALALIIRIVPANAVTAEIYRDGKLIQCVDLTNVSKPYTITLEHGDELNILEIERGRIRMQSANCPDLTCVRQGWISTGVTPIVCLPHRIVIKLIGSAPGRADAVAG